MSESFNTTKLDPARALRLAAECFDSVCVLGLGEAAKGHELAAKALASLPPEYAERIRRILAAQIDYREQARLLADAAAKLPPKPVSKPAHEDRAPSPTDRIVSGRDTEFVSCASLAQRLDCAESTVRELVERGALPRPAKLSPGCVRWYWPDVVAACQSLNAGAAAERDAVDPYMRGIASAVEKGKTNGR